MLCNKVPPKQGSKKPSKLPLNADISNDVKASFQNPSTTLIARCEELRLVLVDTSFDNGRIEEEMLDAKVFFEWFNIVHLLSKINSMRKKNGEVKVLPTKDIGAIGQPRGWICLQKEVLRPDTWTVLNVGDKKEVGQHFPIQFHRDDLPTLGKRHWLVKIVFFNSSIRMDPSWKRKEEETF